MTTPDPNLDAAPAAPAFAAALIDALALAGVKDACISPGSRSTPLVLAIHRHPDLRTHVHLDERSAGFFALGLSRASRRPVAIVCTSGTAAANLLPAAIEAGLSGVPLLLLTADRPPELRDWGAPQTIDQVGLFGRHVRWFAEAPVPDGSPELLRHATALGARAVAVATASPAGPVHLNLPFREPLAPTAATALPAIRADGAKERTTRIWRRDPTPDAEGVGLLCELVDRCERGVLACGPLDDPDAADAIAALGRVAGWPVFAEPASQLRRGAHVDGGVLARWELLLGAAPFAGALVPEVVVRFGALPTSKPFMRWLDRHSPTHSLVVDAESGFRDPSHHATDFFHCAPAALCDAVTRRFRTPPPRKKGWLGTCQHANTLAEQVVARIVDEDPSLLAASAVRTLGELALTNGLLYVANSMAIRDLDTFLPTDARPLRVLANRGANGIDGLISSALGAAHAGRPTVLLTGDLAFLHDASGILAAGTQRVPLTIVVLNDDGGGIFSHLPVAELGAAAGFDRFFRTPHGRDLDRVCAGAGLPHVRAESRAHLRAALKESFARATPCVVEVAMDAHANLAQHRAIRAAVAQELAAR